MTQEWAIEESGSSQLAEYYRHRLRVHFDEVYAGIPMLKFPEDLRIYERLLWDARVSAVVEVGTLQGGSALWFRDRLLINHRYGVLPTSPVVISIDTDAGPARRSLAATDPRFEDTIRLIESDVRDPRCGDLVREQLPPGSRVMVVEDSAHEYETTMAALRTLAGCVSAGSFFVVEDGHRDVEFLRLPEWGPTPRQATVTRAVRDWLRSEEGSLFRVRRDLERYGVTSNPWGFLERVG